MRHVGHLVQLGVSTVEAADPNPMAREKVLQQFGIPASNDPEEALQSKPDVVLVCTPAHIHIATALLALEAGAHVFIEKPLSIDLAGVDALAVKAKENGKIIQVGYNLRYHPAMKAIKRIVESDRLGPILTAHAEFGFYLDRWWPGRDYRQSYMTRIDLGGDLLMDASHEIDSLLWLLGGVERVSAFVEKLSNLEIEGPDLIKVIMRMKSGAIASLHLDCLQPAYTREYSLVGEGTGLRWNCPSGRADQSMGRLVCFDRSADKFQRVRLRGSPEDTYVEELRSFLDCAKTGKTPLVGIEEGIDVLKVIRAIRAAVETGQEVVV